MPVVPYNDLEAKLEAAFQSLLQERIPSGVTHFTGQTADEMTLPRTWCYAHTFAELVTACSIYRGVLEIGVESLGLTDPNEPDPLPAHRLLVAAVRDTILQSTLAADINEEAADLGIELTVIDILNPHFVEEGEPDKSAFRNILNLELVVANANI